MTVDGALKGIRILDLTRVWAGPLATRILGDLGADVIKIEATFARGPKSVSAADVRASGRYPNNEPGERPWNREGMFNKLNRSKRSVTLQLNTPEGLALCEQLVRECDVVIENYTPRVMPQLGLGYDRLKEINPSVVYVSMPGYGWDGPSRNFAALGTSLEPEAGLSSLMGYRGGGPYKSGVAWADPVAAMHAACAVLIGLLDRHADSQNDGQAIELAQLEGMICYIGEEILRAQAYGTNPEITGNRNRFAAPQGVYPCFGRERWIAITIDGDPEWRSFCSLANLAPDWASWDLAARADRHDEIDEAITVWTRPQDRDALVASLQSGGIAAAAVNDAADLVNHPHLAGRGFWAEVDHVDAGRHRFPGLPIHFSETPAAYIRPAPGLGEHNREVLQGMLGVTDEEFDSLLERQIIAEVPPG